MDDEKKLYPFKFIPIDENPAENVLLADLGYQDSMIRDGWLSANCISEVMDTYMDRVTGERSFEFYGRQFPVMLKVINGLERTPLMVCPDDETAAQRLDFLGKAKFWHINSAKPGSRIYLGFKKDVQAEEFYMACRHNTVEDLLNIVEPKEGDCFFVKPGLVHAAGEGVVITEIAESSPLDFRIHNWGKPIPGDEFDAELNLEAAFDFIDYKACPAASCSGKDCPAGCDEFNVRLVKPKDSEHISSSEADSFVLYYCIKGEASLQIPSEVGPVNYTVKAGECLLVPAEVPDFFLIPVLKGTKLLETVIGNHHNTTEPWQTE